MPKTRLDQVFAATLALVASVAGSSSADAEIVRGVQYFHKEFEHYFMTGDQAEIAKLDAGLLPGWYRTGTFYQFETEAKPGLVPVCRFFSSLGGKATHFFTASADECELVKNAIDSDWGDPIWTYEGIAFYARLPNAQSACPAGTAAIHRLYNDGHGGSPNHAYTPDVSKRDRLMANGWISEGVAFCLPASTSEARAKTELLANTIWDFPQPYDGSRYWFREVSNAVFLTEAFAYYNLPELSYVATADGAVAGWDASANQYVLLGGDDWGRSVSLFDRADLPTVPACTAYLFENEDPRYPTGYHPFQRWLWGACVPGAATRIQP